MASRLVSGIVAGGAALGAALQPGLLTVVVLGGLLLIATLVLAAVYSRDPVRRSAAKEVLTLVLRLRMPSTRTPRRRRRAPPPGA